MKTLKHTLTLFAIMLVFLACNQSSVQDTIITVQDYQANQGEPEIDLASHKSGEVEIYRVNYWEKGYEIIYYHDISGEIRDYHFLKIDTVNYNQGIYRWKNDTILTVKVLNSETKQEWNVEFSPTREKDKSGWVRLID